MVALLLNSINPCPACPVQLSGTEIFHRGYEPNELAVRRDVPTTSVDISKARSLLGYDPFLSTFLVRQCGSLKGLYTVVETPRT
jgi:hypothetical protein